MVRAVGVLVLAMFAQGAREKPIQSAHVAGPGGLDGWTESVMMDEVKEQGPLPVALVIARHGKLVRRIDGSPFVWQWQFRPGGTEVAYETGPLHFSMMCVLADIRTRKELDSVDCFGQLPANAPAWVEELERNRQ
jgi:hypothetical protein